MNNYDIEITPQYMEKCTYQYKCGMYPTFDIISEWCNYKNISDIIPPATQSEIIEKLSEIIPLPIITNYYLEMLGYRNVLLPISKRYPDLQSITNRLRYMWITHDIINRNKFLRMIDLLTSENEISPLYDRAVKWTNAEKETPNLRDTTTSSKTAVTDSTDLITKNLSDIKTGSDTRKNTGTVTNVETGEDTKSEIHSGDDSSNGLSSSTTVNGVTSDDQTANFVNDHSETNSGTSSETTTYGEQIDTTSNISATDTRTDNTTEQITFNTTNRHTGTDTHKTDGTETTTTETTATRGGTNQTDASGERFERTSSLNELLDRENVVETILDRYFASVSHDLALYTLEEIW